MTSRSDAPVSTESRSLAEALPAEMARVRELIPLYELPELKGAGAFAAAMMRADLDLAAKVIMSGDVVAMIRVYESLKGYSA